MLRVTLLALLFAGLSTSCAWAQFKPVSEYDARYLAAVRDFVHHVVPSSLDPGEQLILEDSVVMWEMSEFLEGCLSDTTTFSKDERRKIRVWAAHPPFRVWTNDLAPGASLIRKDTVNAIFSDKMDGWKYFNEHFGGGFYTLSCPLFLRNYTWCLFYSGGHCGWLCGSGQLALYKKKGGKWVFVRNWGSWVS